MTSAPVLWPIAGSYAKVCSVVKDLDLSQRFAPNQRQLLAPAHVLPCRLPLTPVPELDRNTWFLGRPAEQFNLNYPLAARYLHGLPGARLISPAYAVLTRQHQLVQESYVSDQRLSETGAFAVQQLRLQLGGQERTLRFAVSSLCLPRQQSEAAAYLPCDYWAFNYHHWLIDCLPALLEYAADPRWQQTRLLLPADARPFQGETLDLLGIDRARVHYFAGDDLACAQLYVPSRGQFAPAELWRSRQRLWTAAGVTPPLRRRRYYISRQDAQQRRVRNEAELLPLLAAWGFECLQLTGLSLRAQIQLFSQAEWVVGPHGAGLSNLLFAPSDCRVLELLPADGVNQCFWVQANALEQLYAYLACPSHGAARDLEVPLGDLDRLLCALGA
ncbi:MAG: glycosyltransferase family 61 protein [Candidatus Sericytochromatia bacterium]